MIIAIKDTINDGQAAILETDGGGSVRAARLGLRLVSQRYPAVALSQLHYFKHALSQEKGVFGLHSHCFDRIIKVLATWWLDTKRVYPGGLASAR